jgi:cytochrome c oxidase subunit 2
LEIAAVILVLVAIVGLPAAALGYESLRHRSYDGQIITLSAADGAWSHDTIRVEQGEKLRLRLTSNDVVHGFALKGYGIEIDEVYPGKVEVIDFVVDKAGTFSFTCTVLCSPHHRDMEGRLVVEPQGG